MGSKTFEGVWFVAYSHDHDPPHIHGRYAGIEVLIEFGEDHTIRQSPRRDAVVPANAKRGDVRRILETARAHADELAELWRAARG